MQNHSGTSRASLLSLLLAGCAGLIGVSALLFSGGTQTLRADDANTSDATPLADGDMQALIDRLYPTYVQIQGGSGVCISADGYVLTNHHVAPEALSRYYLMGRQRGQPVAYSVWMPRRNKALIADPIWADPRGDIVLLKLRLGRGETVPFSPLGDSDAVRVGDLAIAIGNPFMLSGGANEPSVSAGVIAVEGRQQSGYSDTLQTDAALNPGNSGGPLYNSRGEVIGINGRILTAHGMRFNTGVGFAIPANQIKRFIEQHRRENDPATLTRHGLISGLAIAHRNATNEGALVLAVDTGSSAGEAGLKAGDVILKVGDQPARGPGGFYGKLGTWPLHAEVPLTVRRGDQQVVVRALLDVPVSANQAQPWPFAEALTGENEFIFSDLAGWQRTMAETGDPSNLPGFMNVASPLATTGMTAEVVRRAPSQAQRGVRVTGFTTRKDRKPWASEAVIQIGDVITHFEGRRVRYLEELRDCLFRYHGGERVTLTVLKQSVETEVTFELGKAIDLASGR